MLYKIKVQQKNDEILNCSNMNFNRKKLASLAELVKDVYIYTIYVNTPHRRKLNVLFTALLVEAARSSIQHQQIQSRALPFAVQDLYFQSVKHGIELCTTAKTSALSYDNENCLKFVHPIIAALFTFYLILL